MIIYVGNLLSLVSMRQLERTHNRGFKAKESIQFTRDLRPVINQILKYNNVAIFFTKGLKYIFYQSAIFRKIILFAVLEKATETDIYLLPKII